LVAACAGGIIALTVNATAATHELYAWQRQSGPEVVEALRAFAPQVDGVCVLAAEVGWKGGRMTVFRPKHDYAMLGKLGRPIGLALRIGPFGGVFASDDETARSLAKIAREVLADARAGGLEAAELQIDFDCAEAKLAGYGAWLTALRGAAGRTRLTFTALPVWLKHAEFSVLARAADGFVLQVHSLEKPTGPDAPFTLCDPERAVAWARQAGRAGVPFRVALPTYGYALIFDAAGKFLALWAEGPRVDPPRGGRVRVVRAEAPAMARLARRLAEEAAENFTGVIWFRLPVTGDRLNWDARTLAVVLRGEIPERKLICEVQRPEPGLAEIVLVNAGQTTEPLPARVDVSAEGGRLLAVDNLGGFQLVMANGRVQGIVRAVGASEEASLAPGGRMMIAWLRHDHEIPIVVSLPSSPP
jgi:hypothetical protein